VEKHNYLLNGLILFQTTIISLKYVGKMEKIGKNPAGFQLVFPLIVVMFCSNHPDQLSARNPAKG